MEVLAGHCCEYVYMYSKRKYFRKHFFTEGVVKHWNSVLREVVDAQGVSAFKSGLDDALNNTLGLSVSPE